MDKENQTTITTEQAYNAMYAFLLSFNETYQSDDINNLLHGLSTHTDGRPLEDSYSIKWAECIEAARKGGVDTQI